MENTKKYLERASYSWSNDSIRLIATPSASVRNVYFYVQEVGYFKTTPPYFTERANLNSFLIVYTISGSGMLRYNGQEYQVLPNQAFYINCLNHHYYECSQKGNWEMLWVHFNGNGALGYYQEFAKANSPVITFEDTFMIESTLRRILSLTAKKGVHSEIISSNLLVKLITEFLLLTIINNSALITTPQYLKNVMKYLDLHFKEKISLDDLSAAFGVSKHHLSREFKKYIGRTILEYVIECRLNYGKELLRYSDMTVEEISFECGVNTVSHFIYLFKRAENMTPLVYRNEWATK